jgi:hypothetical protein
VSSTRKVEVALAGAEHLGFTGGCDAPRAVLGMVPTTFCSDPAWDPAAAHHVVAHYTTAFLLAKLAGNPSAATNLENGTRAQPGVSY